MQTRHPRDKDIVFDEAPHTYTINGNSSYTSVTTFCHSHFEKFDADKIIDRMMASPKWTRSKYFGQTKEEIKALWKQNGVNAADAGTKLHNDIECYYTGGAGFKTDEKEYKYFLDFAKQMTLKPYRAEWRVYHEDLKLAGSIDMIYEDDEGNLTIVDWKRCKAISKTNIFRNSHTECISHLPDSNFWHYSLQLNTYRMILEEKYDKKVVDMYLICLHPNNDGWQKHSIPFMRTEMENLKKLLPYDVSA